MPPTFVFYRPAFGAPGGKEAAASRTDCSHAEQVSSGLAMPKTQSWKLLIIWAIGAEESRGQLLFVFLRGLAARRPATVSCKGDEVSK